MTTDENGNTWRPGQVLVEFPNGIRVSIITDGYGSEQGLFEAYVTTPNGEAIRKMDLIPGGDGTGIYGWLDPAKLGHLLRVAALYELRTVYVLGEDV